jgi:glycosyltransferase involved in cell wall biosynthesis
MLVSVVTPTLNSAAWIAQCIGSVLMQRSSGFEIEHVIADGGSTDDTVAIARQMGARLVERDPADSLPIAINKATQLSDGDLVGYLGSDDVLLPGALAAVVRRHSTSGKRWITGSYFWTDVDLKPIGRIAAPPAWLTAEALACLNWNLLSPQATYMERTLWEELGGFDTSYAISSDYELFLRAMRIEGFAREPRPIVCYRRHGSNLSIVGPGARAEHRRIQADFGPAGIARRLAYRAALKAFVNARNPVWSFEKLRSHASSP